MRVPDDVPDGPTGSIVTLDDVFAIQDENTVLTDFLKNNNIAVSRVVAIDVLSGGGVTLFVQPVPAP